MNEPFHKAGQASSLPESPNSEAGLVVAVAQVSKPAVSPHFQVGKASASQRARKLPRRASLETCDAAGLEACATACGPDPAPEFVLSRRRFLHTAAIAAAAFASDRVWSSDAPVPTPPRYKIAVCDWMILKRQKLGAFARAKEIGADGVEVDMGGLGDRETFANELAKPEVREQFLAEAAKLKLEISSIAMSGFYAQSFAERATVERMVQDTIDTMVVLMVKTAFLPLGVKGDLVQRPELRSALIERLKMAATKAEQARVVIGVETALDAAAEAKLLDEVGSPAIRSYFNFANALQNNRDLIAELKTLGKDRICQIHVTNADGVWLEHDPKIDLPKVKAALDDMGWSGWLVIERSRDAKDPGNVVRNFGENAAYLKKIFQPA